MVVKKKAWGQIGNAENVKRRKGGKITKEARNVEKKFTLGF